MFKSELMLFAKYELALLITPKTQWITVSQFIVTKWKLDIANVEFKRCFTCLPL